MPDYRPFMDGPFRLHMGLRALDLEHWIERGDDLEQQQARRRVLLDARRAEVFAALPESAPGQAEVLALLLAHIERRFPESYRREDWRIAHLATGEAFATGDFAGAPLELAGRLVQEDLCLMQKAGESYRLVAAVLCFPSRWRLADKIGRPLDPIHAPVPGFAEQLSAPVGRFFANLQAARPVWRANWSLVETPELFLPPEHRTQPIELGEADAGERLWLRVERQTLRRLPATGEVLFTIRTYVEPLARAAGTPEAAGALGARIREMPEPVARYKNIAPVRAPLLAWLDRRAGPPG